MVPRVSLLFFKARTPPPRATPRAASARGGGGLADPVLGVDDHHGDGPGERGLRSGLVGAGGELGGAGGQGQVQGPHEPRSAPEERGCEVRQAPQALRAAVAMVGHDPEPVHHSAGSFLGGALRLLHARPAAPWTVASLAAQVGVSRAGLAKRFTNALEEPPLTYLTRWRMTLAADLLVDDPKTTVAEVARAVGYADAFGFSAAFKRTRGTAPSEFRQRGARGTTTVQRLTPQPDPDVRRRHRRPAREAP